MKILLARPRGFCAGVERAVEIVRRTLDRFGPPVYVRKEIVHNRAVVAELAQAGAVFVDGLDEIPPGSVTVFAAHGVAPAVRAEAEVRGLRVIDATCPLVTKVHLEVQRFARDRFTILLIGHDGHEEVEGVVGEAPNDTLVVSNVADVDRLQLPADTPLAIATQTTLSVDEAAVVIDAIRRRFPSARVPASDDICYATQNRQAAVRLLAQEAQVILVIGSANSSNSRRLQEVAAAAGARAYLIEDRTAIDARWFSDVGCVGVSSGASAPEHLVAGVVDELRARFGVDDVEERVVIEENVHFPLPSELADAHA